MRTIKGLIACLGACLLAHLPSIAISMTVLSRDSLHTTHQVALQVFFKTGHSIIDPHFRANQTRIHQFFTTLHHLTDEAQVNIDSVVLVSSSASPEGTTSSNALLSGRRAAAMEALFRKNCAFDVAVRVVNKGEDWEALASLLRSSRLDGREEAMALIEDTPRWIVANGQIVGGRKKAMMELRGGWLWQEMDRQLFPLLRQATLTIYYSHRTRAIEPAELPMVEPTHVHFAPSLDSRSLPVLPPIASTAGSQPLLALKTNLLADVATFVNVGVEVPLGQRYSLAGEFYFPWWSNSSKDLTIQMLGGTLEGRYWLGERRGKSPLTGFYAGIYGGAGYYDFQLGSLTDGDGVQGDFYVMGGISAGYAHQIGKHLRMEYSLGVGYLRSDYSKYSPVQDTKYGDIKVIHYPWEKKKFSGFLPSKLAVSLVWMLGTRQRGGRVPPSSQKGGRP